MIYYSHQLDRIKARLLRKEMSWTSLALAAMKPTLVTKVVTFARTAASTRYFFLMNTIA